MFSENIVVSDVIAGGMSAGIALSLLKLWEQTAKRGFFDQKLNRKLVHITVGLVFMLCWPMFSYGRQGAIVAALIPGINIIKMLLLGLGIWEDEAAVKSMSRFGDHRELLKGPLYYASTITLACAIFWRTSPTAIAAVCNLCAGDGMFSKTIASALSFFFCLLTLPPMEINVQRIKPKSLKAWRLRYAFSLLIPSRIFLYSLYILYNCVSGMADVVGRHFGFQKLPYNPNKSVIGSITMACAGFLASIGYMLYFSSFGYMEESSKMVLGFLIVSIVAALVESHPISSELDDNLTVPLAAVLIGSLVF